MTVQTWTYPAIFNRQGEEIIVTFPDFPEAVTGASSMGEARALAADALEEAVLAYLAHGRAVPPPRSAAKGEELVALEPLTAGRAAVARIMAGRKVNKVRLALMMRRDEKVVRRILDGRAGVRMETVSAALRALGARSALTVEAARNDASSAR